MKVKVIKKQEREKPRIRPVVMRKMLLDEKSRLMQRVKQIDQTLRTVEA
jgi:hypothetical protein